MIPAGMEPMCWPPMRAIRRIIAALRSRSASSSERGASSSAVGASAGVASEGGSACGGAACCGTDGGAAAARCASADGTPEGTAPCAGPGASASAGFASVASGVFCSAGGTLVTREKVAGASGGSCDAAVAGDGVPMAGAGAPCSAGGTASGAGPCSAAGARAFPARSSSSCLRCSVYSSTSCPCPWSETCAPPCISCARSASGSSRSELGCSFASGAGPRAGTSVIWDPGSLLGAGACCTGPWLVSVEWPAEKASGGTGIGTALASAAPRGMAVSTGASRVGLGGAASDEAAVGAAGGVAVGGEIRVTVETTGSAAGCGSAGFAASTGASLLSGASSAVCASLGTGLSAGGTASCFSAWGSGCSGTGSATTSTGSVLSLIHI